MSIITLPSIPRPEPLRAAPRSTDMSGASSLATAQNNAASSAMNLGAAIVDLLATRGQAEYNQALVKLKTAEMEKRNELNATPIEVLDEENSGTSHDEIDKQTIMKALPNTNALREWRSNYLNNELLPTMKSKRAKEALKLKAGELAIETDSEFMKADYARNKARLADSYTERANAFQSAGDRNEFRATILEAQKIGVYDAVTADDLLDSGFGLMHQNDVVNAAMQAAFSKKPYGDEKAGKEVIGGNLTYKSYDGSEKTISQEAAGKIYDQQFTDKRNAFLNQVETGYRQAEDAFMQKYKDGTLNSQEILNTFQPIEGTSGRELQRYFLNLLKDMSDPGKWTLDQKYMPEIYDILNGNTSVERKVDALHQVEIKNNFPPNSLDKFVTMAKEMLVTPEIRQIENIDNAVMKTFDAKRKDGKYDAETEERAFYFEQMKDGVFEAIKAIGETEKDPIKRREKTQKVLDNFEEESRKFRYMEIATGGDLTSVSTAGGYKVAPKTYLELKKQNTAGLTDTNAVQENNVKVMEFEKRTVVEQFGIPAETIQGQVNRNTGETYQTVVGTGINKFGNDYRTPDNGRAVVLLKMAPSDDDKQVIIKAWNYKRRTWDDYKTIEAQEKPAPKGGMSSRLNNGR